MQRDGQKSAGALFIARKLVKTMKKKDHRRATSGSFDAKADHRYKAEERARKRPMLGREKHRKGYAIGTWERVPMHRPASCFSRVVASLLCAKIAELSP